MIDKIRTVNRILRTSFLVIERGVNTRFFVPTPVKIIRHKIELRQLSMKEAMFLEIKEPSKATKNRRGFFAHHFADMCNVHVINYGRTTRQGCGSSCGEAKQGKLMEES